MDKQKLLGLKENRKSFNFKITQNTCALLKNTYSQRPHARLLDLFKKCCIDGIVVLACALLPSENNNLPQLLFSNSEETYCFILILHAI